MKVYDWKTRGDEPPALETLDLSNMKVAPGSHKSKTRKGRGISAGQGATCGFGYRGQKSRSGRSVRPGFEGGQIPLYRRLPKFVGRPMGPGHSKTLYGIVKLNVLNGCAEGSTVDYASLQEQKFVSKSKCVRRRTPAWWWCRCAARVPSVCVCAWHSACCCAHTAHYAPCVRVLRCVAPSHGGETTQCSSIGPSVVPLPPPLQMPMLGPLPMWLWRRVRAGSLSRRWSPAPSR